MISNLSWSSVGSAFIQTKSNRLYFLLAGVILNKTEANILTQTILVSGHVNQQSRSGSTVSKRSVRLGNLADYTQYDVGIHNLTSQSVVEIVVWATDMSKLYIHETQSQNKVGYGYQFMTQTFIPQSHINVYVMDDENKMESYLGSQTINEKLVGDDVKLIIGESTLVKCKSLIVVTSVLIVEDETTAKI